LLPKKLVTVQPLRSPASKPGLTQALSSKAGDRAAAQKAIL
jgi:hypothetical protein